MTVDLTSHPRWTREELGLPMPDDRHAVSACLPLWQHNIGYEEGDASVVDHLQAAYPRFCFHPAIRTFCKQHFEHGEETGLPFVSDAAAQRASEYVTSRNGRVRRILSTPDGWAGVEVERDSFSLLKQYWQHSGEILSSRAADDLLAGRSVTCTETPERTAVRQKVAELHSVAESDVFLFPSGMAAIAATWRAVRELRPGPTCQFGFPYVDTLKIQERFPGSSHHFFPIGNSTDVDRLEQICEASSPAAVFCESPTNPLLETPDLQRLKRLADTHGFLLVVDDTLGACLNVDVLPFADIVVTSLTKYFSGYGNVLAGSLVVTPGSSQREALLSCIKSGFEETLADVDVRVLDGNSADLTDRVCATNSNAAQLSDFLRAHPAVKDVYYPTAQSSEYEAIRRRDGGYGGLLSIVLHDPEPNTPLVYDALRICKGPNLGTNFTLCCPYTILAHYDELDFAEECGVSRWLLRVSVGIEPFSKLRDRFQTALDCLS